MGKLRLGINSSFALNRWLSPQSWMNIIHSELELDFCELYLDPIVLNLREPTKTAYIQEIIESYDNYNIQIYNTILSKSIVNYPWLCHKDLGFRMNAIKNYENSIEITAGIDALSTGGYLGNYYYLDSVDNKQSIIDNSITQNLVDYLKYFLKLSYYAGLESFLIEPIREGILGNINEKLLEILLNIQTHENISLYLSLNSINEEFNFFLEKYGSIIKNIHINEKDLVQQNLLERFNQLRRETNQEINIIFEMSHFIKMDNQTYILEVKKILDKIKANL